MSDSMKVAKRGALFYVVDSNGNAASLGYVNREEAEEYLSNLSRQAHRSIRTCISCQKSFESEGLHNRMCPRCKRSAG